MIIDTSNLAHAAPAAALGGLIVAGAGLWFVGRKLARAAYVVIGAAMGTAVAMAISQAVGDHGMLSLWLVIGGVAGGVAGWMLFRLCVAVSLAALLALAAPAAVHYGSHGGLPPIFPSATHDAVIHALHAAADGHFADFEDAGRDAYRSQLDAVKGWWNDMGESHRRMLAAAALIAGIGGLIFGLVMPKLCGSLGTSLLGTLLMTAGVVGLLMIYKPAYLDRLPASPVIHLALLGLITAGGVAVQCTLFKRKADK